MIIDHKILFVSVIFSLIIGTYSATAISEGYSKNNVNVGDHCNHISAPNNVTFEETPSWQDTKELPRYCKVKGLIDKRIRFEMRLPKDWNGRFMMAGCGGFCGGLLPDKPGYSNTINEALKRGYAAISHDSGHQAKSWETEWAYQDPEAFELWAHKVLPVVSKVGNTLVKSMYKKQANYKYFSGCSNGGRLGLIAAQRYPDLFDGIAAGGAILDLRSTAGLWGNWMISQTGAEETPILPKNKVVLIKKEVMAKCDAIDGLKDGIIDDPRQCNVNFSQFQCGPDENPETCLTKVQSEMLNSLYDGVRDDSGEIVSPSLSLGSEHYSDIWLFGTSKMPGWGVRASQGYRQLLSNDLFGKETPYSISTNTMLDWIKRSSIPALSDALDTNLSGLKNSNAKLMIYQGWSDPLVIPTPVINYYDKAVEHAGGLEKLKENARLFMLPGWGHCWERPSEAPDQFDPLKVLERWVEKGKSPESFIAEQHDSEGHVIRSRPICAYPQVAKYKSGEDPNKAESYICK